MSTFTVEKDDFCLDGQPFRILGGAMHYFRVHPAYWKDRMQKMKLMGLNTLETYVAWNMHEPRPGEFVFDGWMDLVKYVETAAECGLNVIVRPGPYICAEWEMGALPAWLLKDPRMRFRCSYGPYLDAVDRYLSELLSRLAPLQISNDGPVIAMQIENEYGSYGNDKQYLEHLEKKMRSEGIDVLLFTSDGAVDIVLRNGTLPHILKTVNFGSRAEKAFEILRRHQPEGPLMCMEFWNGWFDHWGAEHHTRDPEDAAAALDDQLRLGASVNFYMFHGGTNFGFMSGANCGAAYQPTITSYDYDAPLNEQGDVTPKFEAFRKVISKYHDVPDAPLPAPTPTMAIAPFSLPESTGLLTSLDVLSSPVKRCVPEPMEYLDQSYGFILYKTHVTGPTTELPLLIRGLHDRAHVFVNGVLAGILNRESVEDDLKLTIPDAGCVILGGPTLFDWVIYPLPLEDLSRLSFRADSLSECPAFYRGQFAVATPQDSFLSLKGWTKGVCWINGFNIGRYWNCGPQQTLYVPRPLFQEGQNEIVLLELDGAPDSCMNFSREMWSRPLVGSARTTLSSSADRTTTQWSSMKPTLTTARTGILH